MPPLVAEGHAVAGMTRSAEKAEMLRGIGAEPVVVDVYDAAALRDAVVGFGPDLVMHQLTDLPDEVAEIEARAEANRRIRIEGTRNLLAAAGAAGAPRFLAQSIAWTPPTPGAAETLEEFGAMVLDAGGLLLLYGQFYGPDTYFPDGPPATGPRIHVDEAARRTLDLLDAPAGRVEVVE